MTLHRVMFATELLTAELIFLFPLPRRRLFAARLLACFAVCISFSGFFQVRASWMPATAAQLLRLTLVYAVTILMMEFCFASDALATAAACAAGYAVEHIAFQIVKMIDMTTVFAVPLLGSASRWEMLECLFFPPIYLFFFLTFGLYARKYQCFRQTDPKLSIVFVAIFLLTIGMNRLVPVYGDEGSITVCWYAIAACLMALSMQIVLLRFFGMRWEKEVIAHLWKENQRQYALNKTTADLIHVKYHDLKKRLSEMKTMLTRKEVDSLEKAISIYDCSVKTGNEALDVILTQDSMLCQSEGIMLAYTGSGTDFSFMSTMDAYSLFANAIDNAMEAVRKVEIPEKRIIDVVTERRGSLTMVNVKNYFSGSLTLDGAVPVTTKREEEGYHGFGIRSMQMIAEKYHGSLDIRLHGEVFELSVTLFSPAE